MLDVGFFVDVHFIKSTEFPSVPGFLKVFDQEILPDGSLDQWIQSCDRLRLLIWWIPLTDFQMLNQLCILRIHPT